MYAKIGGLVLGLGGGKGLGEIIIFRGELDTPVKL